MFCFGKCGIIWGTPSCMDVVLIHKHGVKISENTLKLTHMVTCFLYILFFESWSPIFDPIFPLSTVYLKPALGDELLHLLLDIGFLPAAGFLFLSGTGLMDKKHSLARIQTASSYNTINCSYATWNGALNWLILRNTKPQEWEVSFQSYHSTEVKVSN